MPEIYILFFIFHKTDWTRIQKWTRSPFTSANPISHGVNSSFLCLSILCTHELGLLSPLQPQRNEHNVFMLNMVGISSQLQPISYFIRMDTTWAIHLSFPKSSMVLYLSFCVLTNHGIQFFKLAHQTWRWWPWPANVLRKQQLQSSEETIFACRQRNLLHVHLFHAFYQSTSVY